MSNAHFNQQVASAIKRLTDENQKLQEQLNKQQKTINLMLAIIEGLSK